MPDRFLLDEPEVVLSPLSQLAFMSLAKAAGEQGAQLLIATHALRLMAYPDAWLYEIRGVVLAQFEELADGRAMRDLLEASES